MHWSMTPNPGVRVEAVNVLVGSLQHGEPGEKTNEPEVATQLVSQLARSWTPPWIAVVQVLEQLQRQDPSRYVRLRSAAALRQIGPREVQ